MNVVSASNVGIGVSTDQSTVTGVKANTESNAETVKQSSNAGDVVTISDEAYQLLVEEEQNQKLMNGGGNEPPPPPVNPSN